MKMFKYTFGLLLGALVFLSSCRDFVDPAIPYTEFDTAAYLRTIERTSTDFNFFDLGNSNFALILEAVDAEDGATLENVEIRVRHRRLIPGVGLEYSPALENDDALIRTLQKSDFAPNAESKFLRASFTISAAEALQAVGLTAAEIEGGDAFEFRLVLNDRFGRVFTNTNADANVLGSPFYASPFFYNVPVVCPSDLEGTFTYSTTNIVAGAGGDADACAEPVTGEVSFTATSGAGQYNISDVSFGQFDCAWGDTPPGGTVRINDACGTLAFSGTDKYGDSYTFTFVSNDGTNLAFDWVNSYGDGGSTVLTSSTAGFWPANLN